MKIYSFFFICIVFCTAVKAQEEVRPDLGFDGFRLVVPDLPEIPSFIEDCASIKENFKFYQGSEEINREANAKYAVGVAEVLEKWHKNLVIYEKLSIRFAVGSFQPVESLAENLSIAKQQIEKNGSLIDEYLYNLVDFAEDCGYESSIIGDLDFYERRVSETNSQLSFYFKEVGARIEVLFRKYQAWEGQNITLNEGEFVILKALASAQNGSGGVREANYWYNQKFFDIYNQELAKLILRLNAPGRP